MNMHELAMMVNLGYLLVEPSHDEMYEANSSTASIKMKTFHLFLNFLRIEVEI